MSPYTVTVDMISTLRCVACGDVEVEESQSERTASEKHFEDDQEPPRRWAPPSGDPSLPKAVSEAVESTGNT